MFWCLSGMASLNADDQRTLMRCEVIPQPGHQVAVHVDGIEKLSWHYGTEYPRPFFYPFNGPSGQTLTRMGHPGAQNHDHHRSVWFAHHDVNGSDFWSDTSRTQIRQKHWYRYRDGDAEAVLAVRLGWYDQEDREVLDTDVVAAVIPLSASKLSATEHLLELQITARPPRHSREVVLGKTNFGFLAVRMAKSISAFFGGGVISNSEGLVGEADIFGKSARWMDYSGPVATGTGNLRRVRTEGITFFDHPANPRYPTKWHVREDGWMGASFFMEDGLTISSDDPLTLRYLLYAHTGPYDPASSSTVHDAFALRPGFRIRAPKSGEKHRQFEVERQNVEE